MPKATGSVGCEAEPGTPGEGSWWGNEVQAGTRGKALPGQTELLSCLPPPPLPECNLPKPLIKIILEVIKVSPKICSFSKLSLKKNLWSGEI